MKARRTLPRYATVGEPVAYSVTFSHASDRAQRALSAVERLDSRRPDARGRRATLEPAEFAASRCGRYVGYPQWLSMMRRRRGGRCRELELPDLAPHVPTTVEMTLVPERRGYLRLDRIEVLRADPLGLFRARVETGARESILVLPRRYRVQWPQPATGAPDRPGGATPARSNAGLEEFATLREYRRGDPLRHIHWRGWARLGVPVVKEFHEECFARQALVLDVHRPARGTRRQFEAAVSVAASLADCGPERTTSLDLLFLGPDVHRVAGGPGSGSPARLLEALACVDLRPEQSFDLVAEAVKTRAGELSACVCVLLDWDGVRRRFVSELRALGLGTLVAVVVDAAADEASLACPGGPADASIPTHVIRADRLEEDLAGLGAVPASSPGAVREPSLAAVFGGEGP